MFKNSDLITLWDKEGTRQAVGSGDRDSDLPREAHKESQRGPCGHWPRRDEKRLTGAQVGGNDYRGTLPPDPERLLGMKQTWGLRGKTSLKAKEGQSGLTAAGPDGDSDFLPSFCPYCSHYLCDLGDFACCQFLESSVPTVTLSIGVGGRKSHSVFIIKGLAMA